MDQKMIKILSIGGLVLSVAGAIVTNIAGTQATQAIINEAVNAKFAELSK